MIVRSLAWSLSLEQADCVRHGIIGPVRIVGNAWSNIALYAGTAALALALSSRRRDISSATLRNDVAQSFRIPPKKKSFYSYKAGPPKVPPN